MLPPLRPPRLPNGERPRSRIPARTTRALAPRCHWPLPSRREDQGSYGDHPQPRDHPTRRRCATPTPSPKGPTPRRTPDCHRATRRHADVGSVHPPPGGEPRYSCPVRSRFVGKPCRNRVAHLVERPLRTVIAKASKYLLDPRFPQRRHGSKQQAFWRVFDLEFDPRLPSPRGSNRPRYHDLSLARHLGQHSSPRKVRRR